MPHSRRKADQRHTSATRVTVGKDGLRHFREQDAHLLGISRRAAIGCDGQKTKFQARLFGCGLNRLCRRLVGPVFKIRSIADHGLKPRACDFREITRADLSSDCEFFCKPPNGQCHGGSLFYFRSCKVGSCSAKRCTTRLSLKCLNIIDFNLLIGCNEAFLSEILKGRRDLCRRFTCDKRLYGGPLNAPRPHNVIEIPNSRA